MLSGLQMLILIDLNWVLGRVSVHTLLQRGEQLVA